jgi:hypothetical protein
MADEITYYAIVDDYTSRDEPAGVLCRFADAARRDESFGRDQEWKCRRPAGGVTPQRGPLRTGILSARVRTCHGLASGGTSAGKQWKHSTRPADIATESGTCSGVDACLPNH